jgi:hypothetical protein
VEVLATCEGSDGCPLCNHIAAFARAGYDHAMTESRSEELKRRLGELNRRIAEKRALQDVEHLRSALQQVGIAYEFHLDAKPLFDWAVDKYNINQYGWLDAPVLHGEWQSSHDLLTHFSQLATSENLRGKAHFIWVYGPDSAFTFELTDLMQDKDILQMFFEQDSEFWIADTTGAWCFVAHHEGGFYFTR